MPGCCGGSPVEGDKLHGVTVDELVNDKGKRDRFSDKCFATFDTNKNGMLEKREMQAAAVHLMNTFKGTHDFSLSDKEFNKIWKQTDANEDGKVDKAEFRKYMKRIIDQTLAKGTLKGGKGSKASKGKSAKGKGKKKSSDEDSAEEETPDTEDESGSGDGEEESEEQEEVSWYSEQEESEDESGSGAGSGSEDEEEGGDELTQFIAHHNKLRKKHGCGKLEHDPELSKSAMKWAKTMAKKEQMFHSDAGTNGIGENLFSGTNKDWTPKEATQAWYDEIKLYNFSNPGFSSQTGHFTALIWKDVERVGYAKIKSKKGTVFIVGHYSPQPNMLGEFEENVPEPL
jgi:uncharacterized protein YkwD